MKVNIYVEKCYFHRHYRYSTCYYPCIFEIITDKVLLPFSMCIHGANRLVVVNSEYITSFKHVEICSWLTELRRWRLKKKRNKLYGAISNNLSCEKTNSLTYHFYFEFRLPIVVIKHINYQDRSACTHVYCHSQYNIHFMTFASSSNHVFVINDHYL